MSSEEWGILLSLFFLEFNSTAFVNGVCVYIPYSSIEKQKVFCEKAKKLLLRALFLIKMMKKTNKTIYFSAPLEFKTWFSNKNHSKLIYTIADNKDLINFIIHARK